MATNYLILLAYTLFSTGRKRPEADGINKLHNNRRFKIDSLNRF